MQPTIPQGFNRYFKDSFKDFMNTSFNQGEQTQLFSQEGMMFHINGPYIAPGLNDTHWRVNMSWHTDNQDQIDGIFIRAISADQNLAWIATDPNSQEDTYNPCYVHINKETIFRAYTKAEIPGDQHGGAPELVKMVLQGRRGSGSNRTFQFLAATVLLLGLAYIAKKCFLSPNEVPKPNSKPSILEGF